MIESSCEGEVREGRRERRKRVVEVPSKSEVSEC